MSERYENEDWIDGFEVGYENGVSHTEADIDPDDDSDEVVYDDDTDASCDCDWDSLDDDTDVDLDDEDDEFEHSLARQRWAIRSELINADVGPDSKRMAFVMAGVSGYHALRRGARKADRFFDWWDS